MAKFKKRLCAILVVGCWFAFSVVGAPGSARAASSTVLSHRVEAALRANDNLNGANCYAAAPGVIVLYGKVFDNKDRDLAESTAFNVHGVKQVVNTLRTTTGKWLEEEARINDTLVLNEDIALASSTGYAARLQEAVVDMHSGNVVSDKPVAVKLLNGFLNAKRMIISENGNVIHFDGGVTMVLHPDQDPDKAKTQ